MSTSDQDMSEGSNSPASYTTLESPQSSPLQQVPQLPAKLPDLSCTDKNLYNNGNTTFLNIIEEPQKHFRFRYNTESSSTHGSILGRSFNDRKTDKKTHPTVELVNFVGEALIKCSIKYDDNGKNIPKNIYKILEDEQNVKSCKVPVNNSFKVGFPGVSVVTYTKKNLADLLHRRLLELASKNSLNTSQLRSQCDNMAKNLDQNIVRLKFTAHDLISGKEICEPVFSDTILNKKSSATNALKICRMSLCSGRPSGWDQLILLVDKIDKTDIKVRFYEEDETGKHVWEKYAEFSPSDVHYQYAITCNTPPYKDRETPVDVKVFVELVRTSNGSTSKPHQFLYIADPVHKYSKRRKIATPRSCRSESTYSGTSSTLDSTYSGTSSTLDEAPVIVLQNYPQEYTENVSSQLPLASENQWNMISTSHEIIQDVSGVQEPQEASPMWGPCYLVSQNPSGNAAQTSMQYPAANSQPVEFTLQPLRSEGKLSVAAPISQSSTVDLGITFQPTQSSAVQFSIAELPSAPPFSAENAVSNDELLENDYISNFLENDLGEYLDQFGENLDLFSLDMENNHLIGDSGRVKELTTSSTQTGDVAGTEETVSREDDGLGTRPQGPLPEAGALLVNANYGADLCSQSGEGPSVATLIAQAEIREWITPNSAENVVEPQMDTTGNIINVNVFEIASPREQAKILLGVKTTEDDPTKNSGEKDEELISVRQESGIDGDGVKAKVTFVLAQGTSSDCEVNENEGTSERVDAGAGIDYPSFSAKDGEEVKKLVRELCEIIREKKTAKSEVTAKLDRLFDIRLSNGDTFLHVTLFKSHRSFEALIKIINSVKMSHLLNYGNNRGETILHLAMVQGSPELVSQLVAKGCDPMARNCENETAVHYAVRYASADTLRALLDAAQRHGVELDLDAANAERQSALHLCVVEERARCAAMLCAQGASCGTRDAAGRTPLHLCAYDARVQVARSLLPHVGAHVDALDVAGRTPLAVACERAPTPPAIHLVRALLAAGARADRAWLAAREHPTLAELLRPHIPTDVLLASDTIKSAKSEADDSDTDEYESADDEYADDATQETLSWKLREMALTDNAEDTKT